MIASAIGVQTAVFAAAIFLGADPSSATTQIHGFVYALITVGCGATVFLSLVQRVRASELALTATAFVGSAGVLMTSPSRSVLIPVICALHVMVMLPGVAVLSIGGRSMLFWTTGVYVVGVVLRLALRPEEPVGSFGELLLTVVPPVFSVSIVWLMHRALMER